MKIILEEKILGTHSKKNSRYYWVLETITGKSDLSENPAEFPLESSEEGYLQDIKEEILQRINGKGIFSFQFTPKEGDYLSFKNNLRKREYLNLIFSNGKWVEEVYTCSLRNCETDVYTTIRTGVAFLSDNII